MGHGLAFKQRLRHFLKKYSAVVSLQTVSHVSSQPAGAKSLVKNKLQE